jgi:hypothetical protein
MQAHDPLPRFDSQLSLHQDVANFLTCVRLSLTNPTLQLDETQLNRCVGFAHLFPHIDGITPQMWGRPMGALASTSQQGMLLWMQGLQQRIDDATAKNLDRAAAAFGPCEEARLARGVSGRSDVEGVRQDLEWWLKQHGELGQRLRNQRQYIRQLLHETRSVSASTAPPMLDVMLAENDDELYFYQQRVLERQQEAAAKNNNGSRNSTLEKMFQKPPASSSSQQQQQQQQQRGSEAGGLNNSIAGNVNPFNSLVDGLRLTSMEANSAVAAAAAARRHSSARSDVSDARSTSGTTVGHMTESLGAELLALQAMRQRVEGIAESREKLVKAVVSLGSPSRTYVRTATAPPF